MRHYFIFATLTFTYILLLISLMQPNTTKPISKYSIPTHECQTLKRTCITNWYLPRPS